VLTRQSYWDSYTSGDHSFIAGAREGFKGIVIVDEAYIDFVDDASKTSAVQLVKEYANLCVMQTWSKSFGLTAIRCAFTVSYKFVYFSFWTQGLVLALHNPP